MKLLLIGVFLIGCFGSYAQETNDCSSTKVSRKISSTKYLPLNLVSCDFNGHQFTIESSNGMNGLHALIRRESDGFEQLAVISKAGDKIKIKGMTFPSLFQISLNAFGEFAEGQINGNENIVGRCKISEVLKDEKLEGIIYPVE